MTNRTDTPATDDAAEGGAPRPVVIKLGYLGGSRIDTVEVAGVDLSGLTHGLTVRARNGYVAEVALDLALLTEGASFAGDAMVTVGTDTADALKLLGWTPPPGDARPEDV